MIVNIVLDFIIFLYNYIRLFFVYCRIKFMYNNTNDISLYFLKWYGEFRQISTKIGTTKPIHILVHKSSELYEKIKSNVSIPKSSKKLYSLLRKIRDEPKLFYIDKSELNLDNIYMFITKKNKYEFGVLSKMWKFFSKEKIKYICPDYEKVIDIEPHERKIYTKLISIYTIK